MDIMGRGSNFQNNSTMIYIIYFIYFSQELFEQTLVRMNWMKALWRRRRKKRRRKVNHVHYLEYIFNL